MSAEETSAPLGFSADMGAEGGTLRLAETGLTVVFEPHGARFAGPLHATQSALILDRLLGIAKFDIWHFSGYMLVSARGREIQELPILSGATRTCGVLPRPVRDRYPAAMVPSDATALGR